MVEADEPFVVLATEAPQATLGVMTGTSRKPSPWSRISKQIRDLAEALDYDPNQHLLGEVKRLRREIEDLNARITEMEKE